MTWTATSPCPFPVVDQEEAKEGDPSAAAAASSWSWTARSLTTTINRAFPFLPQTIPAADTPDSSFQGDYYDTISLSYKD